MFRTLEVEADRLEEIQSSYSGDTIAGGKTVRKPFKFEGKFYVSVGGLVQGPNIINEECYMIVPRQEFKGDATYYAKKLTWHVTLTKEEKRDAHITGEDWSAHRRSQPEGFYHRMLVKRGKSDIQAKRRVCRDKTTHSILVIFLHFPVQVTRGILLVKQWEKYYRSFVAKWHIF